MIMVASEHNLFSQALYKLINHSSFQITVARPAQNMPSASLLQKTAKIAPSAAKPSSTQVMGA